MYGIDLGTTNSVISKYDSNTDTFETSELLPSVVNLKTRDVGKVAKQQLYNLDENVTSSYKVNIIHNYAKVASYAVLRTLKNQVNDTSDKICISVPAYFNAIQRNMTIEAAKRAGWDEVLLINEPTAAILAYGHKNKGVFCVYDLGGGTFDVSLMQVDGRYRTIGTYGKDLGGDNLDYALVELFKADIIEYIHPVKFEEKHYKQLKEILNSTKHTLQRTQKDTKFYYMGKEYVLTIEEYKNTVDKVFRETLYMIDAVLSTHKFDNMNIIFVGGSTRDPYLRDMVKEYIEKRGIKVHIMPIDYDQDKIVAEGAAIYASLYERGELNIVTEVTDSLGVNVLNENNEEVCYNIIPKNSIIPVSSYIIIGSEIGQEELDLDLYKGLEHGALLNDKTKIGKISWDIVDNTKENMFRVAVSVDYNGVIKLTATDIDLDISESLEIC